MNTIRFNSKEAFVTAMESRRRFWRAQDAKAAKAHRAAEQKWLKETKAKMRQAANFDYEQMKAAFSYNRRDEPGILYNLGGGVPSCPALHEHRLDRVINALSLTQAKVFTVDSKTGAWTVAYDLLTADPDAKTTVC